MRKVIYCEETYESVRLARKMRLNKQPLHEKSQAEKLIVLSARDSARHRVLTFIVPGGEVRFTHRFRRKRYEEFAVTTSAKGSNGILARSGTKQQGREKVLPARRGIERQVEAVRRNPDKEKAVGARGSGLLFATVHAPPFFNPSRFLQFFTASITPDRRFLQFFTTSRLTPSPILDFCSRFNPSSVHCSRFTATRFLIAGRFLYSRNLEVRSRNSPVHFTTIASLQSEFMDSNTLMDHVSNANRDDDDGDSVEIDNAEAGQLKKTGKRKLVVFVSVVFIRVYSYDTVKFVSCPCRVRVQAVSCLCFTGQTRIIIRVVFVFGKFVSCKFVSDTNTRHDDTDCQEGRIPLHFNLDPTQNLTLNLIEKCWPPPSRAATIISQSPATISGRHDLHDHLMTKQQPLPLPPSSF
ncbi:hypothetical protein LXL04_022717 [Taraxacum kok-saghyz]